MRLWQLFCGVLIATERHWLQNTVNAAVSTCYSCNGGGACLWNATQNCDAESNDFCYLRNATGNISAGCLPKSWHVNETDTHHPCQHEATGNVRACYCMHDNCNTQAMWNAGNSAHSTLSIVAVVSAVVGVLISRVYM